MSKACSSPRRIGRLAAPAIAAVFLALSAPAAQANGGLLDFLFGGGEPAASRPAVQRPDPANRTAKPVRKAKRLSATTGTGGKTMPLPAVAAFTDPSDMILNDPTLRRGDVVVFPTGAKVFVARSAQAPWSPEDFEALETSKAVPSGARAAVVAATSNIHSTPALVVLIKTAPTPVKVAATSDERVN